MRRGEMRERQREREERERTRERERRETWPRDSGWGNSEYFLLYIRFLVSFKVHSRTNCEQTLLSSRGTCEHVI